MKNAIKLGFGISFGIGIGIIVVDWVRIAQYIIVNEFLERCDEYIEKHDEENHE